jgi:hypothetical protein
MLNTMLMPTRDEAGIIYHVPKTQNGDYIVKKPHLLNH